MAHPQIASFARLAKENTRPNRLLAGQKTLLARTMHDIRYDAIHDEILVANPFAHAILVFRGGADGDDAPIRVIQGTRTHLSTPISIRGESSGKGVDRLDVDPVHNEIYAPAGDQILVFPREANGDVPPVRIIRSKDTRVAGSSTLAVDPVSNLLFVGSGFRPAAEETKHGEKQYTGALVVYNRTDNGTVQPRRIITGPKTGIVLISQIQVYKNWVVGTQQGGAKEVEPEGVFVGVWSIHDDGDVPPRWKLAGPATQLKRPRGVVLNPKHKELIIADMRLNSVLTYSFPEIF